MVTAGGAVRFWYDWEPGTIRRLPYAAGDSFMRRGALVTFASILLGAGPAAFADEPVQRLLYLVSPDAAGGRGGKGIFVFDIDHGHKLVRKIELPVKGVRGVCGSV